MVLQIRNTYEKGCQNYEYIERKWFYKLKLYFPLLNSSFLSHHPTNLSSFLSHQPLPPSKPTSSFPPPSPKLTHPSLPPSPKPISPSPQSTPTPIFPSPSPSPPPSPKPTSPSHATHAASHPPSLKPTSLKPKSPKPSLIAPSPVSHQPLSSPTASQIVQILSGRSNAEITPPPPPKPIFAALGGGHLAAAEAEAIAKMQLAIDQHHQRKAEGVRIARNGPRRARTSADRSARRPVTRSSLHRPAWLADFVGVDDILTSPNRRLSFEAEISAE